MRVLRAGQTGVSSYIVFAVYRFSYNIEEVPEAAELIRSARHRSGLTQQQLAERLRTSQTAVARLERAGSNPTVAMLRRALAAADHGLEMQATHRPSGVDLPQLRHHMRMSPADRLAAHQAAYDNLRMMLARSARRG